MQDYIITHYYHSGFSVACGQILLIFDYWRGEKGELPEDQQLTPEILSAYEQIYVFISHDHPDHLDPVVFSWKNVPGIQYIVSSDMPVGTRGRRMAPGDVIVFSEDLKVTAFDSTDLGVSFLAELRGMHFFHAGDLNFWHWREESTMKEIEEADAEFRKAIAPISKQHIDVAFFPVDPRQGAMFEAGANFFILSVKPRIMIPMHYFDQAEVAMEYARTASCRSTEVIALPGYGDMLGIEKDEEDFLNLFVPELENAEDDAESKSTGNDDPFLETDLPLSQLTNKKPAESPEEADSGDPSAP